MKFGPTVYLYGRYDLPRFMALVEGCKAKGVRPHLSRAAHFRASDADPAALGVVVDGLGREAKPIADAYRKLGVPVWVIELPRLRMEATAHALLLDSLHWLPEWVNGRPIPDIPKLKSRKPAEMLVALQKPGDAAHGMSFDDLMRWARSTVAHVRAVTGKPVVVRPHPKHEGGIPDDIWGADRLSDPATQPLADALRTAEAVVTYNSTTGWDAIAAGVPVVALADHDKCAYHRYSTTLADLAPLSPKHRLEALARVASTQWTLDELRNGDAVAATLLSFANVPA